MTPSISGIAPWRPSQLAVDLCSATATMRMPPRKVAAQMVARRSVRSWTSRGDCPCQACSISCQT
eukprot:7309736-Lingulodinium_polyedra.AAC.1